MDIVLAWDETSGPPIRYNRISKSIVTVLMVSPERTVAKNANLIESGMRLHVQALSGDDGVAVAAVEVSLDTTMTGSPTGIGIGIARGAMRMTMVLDEVAGVADPITID